jgi:phospholipase D1/2
MIATSERRLITPDTSSTAPAIVQPGKNCWKVERADRFRCVQDGADYFRAVRQSLLNARKTVFILGWDILATVDLEPGGSGPDAPTRLGELLAFIARRRPKLRCYILIWDYAALYTLERDPFSRWRLGWQTPRHVKFGFDDCHPLGASHHQKIVVVDDQLALCGGIDLTGHRWDTCAHRIEEPARVSGGSAYGPYHEVAAMVSGPIAASLGVLARDRWRALGEERMPALNGSAGDLWPSDVTPDLTDVGVAIARTVPRSETQPAIRECESLYLDSIAYAKRSIYIESQYFTNDRLSAALAARLREPNGPEIVVIAPRDCEGWLESNTMGAFRDSVFRQLLAADTHKRLRLVYPIASRAQNVPTFVHSKVMIVDDELVRIGSANFSRRSMGFDTECDIAVDAGGDTRVRGGIRHIRDRLVAEHLGLPVDAIAHRLEHAGSLRALIDERERAEHTLVRIDVASEEEGPPSEVLRAAADPDEPMAFGPDINTMVPPVDATYRRSPLRLRIVPAIVLAAAAASIWSALIGRPDFGALQDLLVSISNRPSAFWTAGAVFLLANLVMIPVELMAVAAGVLFGSIRGGVVALIGSLGAAVIGYVAGRAMGPQGITRWMTRRSYQSGRQLGARGVIGVLVLRVASVASTASIHLLCGAGRVPFTTYMIGTVIGFVPAIAALSALGGLFRHTLLHPSVTSGAVTIGAALLLIACAAGLRTFLLMRQFAPSVSKHRRQAEWG